MEILLFFILIILFIHLLISIKEKIPNFYSENINIINFKTTCVIVLGIISIMLANGTSFFNWYKKDLIFIIIYSSLLFVIEISFPKIKNLFFLSTIPYFFIGNDIIGGLINKNHRITIFGEIVIETIAFIILIITTLLISYKRKNKINRIDFFITLVILFITLIVQFNSFNSFKKYQNEKIRLIEEKMTLEKYFNTIGIEEKDLLNKPTDEYLKDTGINKKLNKVITDQTTLTKEEQKKLDEHMKTVKDKEEYIKILEEMSYRRYLLNNRTKINFITN